MTQAFLVDAMCGSLARYLRFCGYDAAFAPDRGIDTDRDAIVLARKEGRTIITRDRSLAAAAPDAIAIESHKVVHQLAELHEAGTDLEVMEVPTRCGRCNGPLVAVDPDDSRPEYVAEPAPGLAKCTDCGQYFWRGSHWERVVSVVESARQE